MLLSFLISLILSTYKARIFNLKYLSIAFAKPNLSQKYLLKVRKDYEHLTVAGKDMPIILAGRKDILSQKEQSPDPKV